MKKLLGIIVLSLLLSVASKADDISNFEIEGISIGDSALDHFNINQIKNNSWDYYKKKQFTPVQIENFSVNGKNFFDNYDAVDFDFKTDDKKFIIESINGIITNYDNYNECLSIKEKITNDLKKLFKDTQMGNGEGKHRADPTGKSFYNVSYFDFENGDTADVTCYKFSSESGHQDNLAVRLNTKEFINFMRSNPYE